MSENIILNNKKSKLAFYCHQDQYYPIFYRPTGVNIRILESSWDLVANWIGYYSKFCAVFLQLHQSQPSEDNKQLSKFLRILTKRLSKHYSTPNIGYFWVREHSGRDKQHYHLMVLISGHCCQHSGVVDKLTREVWKEIDKNNSNYEVKRRVYKVNRYGHDKERRALLTRLSYFAKNDSKTVHGSRHNFGRSQLLKKPRLKNHE
ncbi:hypothetical protein BA894_01340 [Vibrio natriegens]|uniref:YagK/YfjJ domain-containing protein n=1 Tax=Vibrio natriegens TaxID=691 RepID=UPI000803EE4E|nr:inovirus-type Gp2 protein [Vibrio natriegens]ANQ25174.1 hypothetical protein BA894_01340 [Vibrio natriegens]